MRMYPVGGFIRDEIMGLRSKDIDYVVVLDGKVEMDPFELMIGAMEDMGFKLIEETFAPKFGTARGFFPDWHPLYPKKPADFVLARKEGAYSDGRRPDSVEIGTLEDDLARRDFTMNAIARDDYNEGVLIDPYNGVSDIKRGIIRAVGDPHERLREDALRAIRALRFMVTKGMSLHLTLADALQDEIVLSNLHTQIADERIAAELSTMLQKDTYGSLKALNMFPKLMDVIFSGRVSLDSTLKTKGRG